MAEFSKESLSMIAAIVSAVGTVFAALAARRSAESARMAQQAAAESERRSALLQISLLAVDVGIEAKRVKSSGEANKVAHNDLAVFTNTFFGSRLETRKREIDEIVAQAAAKAEHAQLFQRSFEKLGKAPGSEIDRVQILLQTNIRELAATRQQLDEECEYVRAQFPK